LSSIINRLKEGNIGQLINNFLSLAFLQLTNFILPIVVIPHLVDKLKIDRFGLVSFGQVLSLYLVIFSEYGFNLSATKDVSVNRDNKARLTEIFNSVITTRIFLSVIGFIFLCAIVFIVPQLREDWLMYLLGSTMMFGQALVPVWFFLGIEKMRFITYLNLVSKLVFTLMIYVFVQDRDDYIYPNMFHGLGSLIAGLICFYIVRTRFDIRFRFASVAQVREQLHSAFFIFVSNFSANIYMNINIVILKFVSTPDIVGMFSVAEKVFVAAKHIISVVFQTVYPYSCKLYIESQEKLKLFYIRFQIVVGFGFLAFGIFTYVFANEIIFIMARQSLPYSVTILRLLSFIPFFIALNIPAYHTLLISDLKKGMTISMVSASILNIILNIVLGLKFDALGTVVAIAASELLVLAAFNVILWKKTGINYFGLNQSSLSLRT
jgi:polysaccharide transporter, PST family